MFVQVNTGIKCQVNISKKFGQKDDLTGMVRIMFGNMHNTIYSGMRNALGNPFLQQVLLSHSLNNPGGFARLYVEVSR